MDCVSERAVSPLGRRQHRTLHDARRPCRTTIFRISLKTAAAVSGRLPLWGASFDSPRGGSAMHRWLTASSAIGTENVRVAVALGVPAVRGIRRPNLGGHRKRGRRAPSEWGYTTALPFIHDTQRAELFRHHGRQRRSRRQPLARDEQRRRDEIDPWWLQHVRRARWYRDGPRCV